MGVNKHSYAAGVATPTARNEEPRVEAHPRFSRPRLAIAVTLMVAFALQGLIASRRDSVTIDEFFHLPVGLNALRNGDFRQDPVNAHLARMFFALPLLVQPPAFSPAPGLNETQLGYDFLDANKARYQQIYEKVRPMVLLTALLLAAVMAKWAFDLYGADAALVALALFAFSPSLLAHGHLVTVDVAGTLGFLLALYANWRFLDSPSTRTAIWLGVAAGAANLLTLSGAVLAMMMIPPWIVRMTMGRRTSIAPREWARLLLVVGVVSLATLNTGYGFDGTLGLLRDATLAPAGRLSRIADG